MQGCHVSSNWAARDLLREAADDAGDVVATIRELRPLGLAGLHIQMLNVVSYLAEEQKPQPPSADTSPPEGMEPTTASRPRPTISRNISAQVFFVEQ